jgi:cystathionine gamma-synthase
MVSFDLRGGVTAVRAFVEGLQHICLAESLGGIESLVAHPATMTHASMDAEARKVAGIGDGLLRLSVGIESAEDLVRDVVAALARAERVAEGGGKGKGKGDGPRPLATTPGDDHRTRAAGVRA